MPRTCTICNHPDRQAIEAALVAGQSLRNIAKRFGVSAAALLRHRASHLPASLVRAKEAAEVARADTLLAQLKALQSRALDILHRAEASGDLRTALAGVREVRECLELLAELTHELDRRGLVSVNLLTSPEWIAVRTALMRALAPYPEARAAVAAALVQLEEDGAASRGH